MPFSTAANLSEATDKATRNIWTIFSDVNRSVSSDVESFRKAVYEGSGPLNSNALAAKNTIQRQSLQGWNVSLQEVKNNPAVNAGPALSTTAINRANLYKYIRAVQYTLIACQETFGNAGTISDQVRDLYNNILAS